MRTTLTIDDDVAAEIDQLRRAGERSFKELVNDLLRRGLRAQDEVTSETKGSYTFTQDLGEPLLSVDDISAALAAAEGEDFR